MFSFFDMALYFTVFDVIFLMSKSNDWKKSNDKSNEKICRALQVVDTVGQD